MNKNAVLKYLNPLLGLLFLVQASTGLILKFGASHLAEEIHEFTGPLFIIVVVLHLTLNYPWIKSTYFKGKKK